MANTKPDASRNEQLFSLQNLISYEDVWNIFFSLCAAQRESEKLLHSLYSHPALTPLQMHLVLHQQKIHLFYPGKAQSSTKPDKHVSGIESQVTGQLRSWYGNNVPFNTLYLDASQTGNHPQAGYNVE